MIIEIVSVVLVGLFLLVYYFVLTWLEKIKQKKLLENYDGKEDKGRTASGFGEGNDRRGTPETFGGGHSKSPESRELPFPTSSVAGKDRASAKKHSKFYRILKRRS